LELTSKFSSLVACGVYYFVWVKWLPRIKKYELRQTVLELDDGAVTHKLVKVPNDDLAKWDAEHDVTGRITHREGHRYQEDPTGPVEKV
jgi:hypothetical protein